MNCLSFALSAFFESGLGKTYKISVYRITQYRELFKYLKLLFDQINMLFFLFQKNRISLYFFNKTLYH